MEKARMLVHTLTAIHGLGSLAVLGMAIFVLISSGNAERLAVTPGGQQLVDWTGAFLPVFFVALGLFLGALSWGSYHKQGWSWPAAVIAYTIGVLGSLIEIAAGHPQYWASLAVNGFVVTALLSTPVRREFAPERRWP